MLSFQYEFKRKQRSTVYPENGKGNYVLYVPCLWRNLCINCLDRYLSRSVDYDSYSWSISYVDDIEILNKKVTELEKRIDQLESK